jgi:hypothetical protein
MTREEKCVLAIEKGYTYDELTGKIYGVRDNKEITSKNNNGYLYIQISINSKRFILLAHHFSWYIVNNQIVEQIDHIDGNRENNKINNLRAVTNQQNSFNRKHIKGCSYHKRDKIWQSGIGINGKRIHLGTYNTEEEAHRSYLDAKKKYHLI